MAHEFVAGLAAGVTLMAVIFVPWCWRLQSKCAEQAQRYGELQARHQLLLMLQAEALKVSLPKGLSPLDFFQRRVQ